MQLKRYQECVIREVRSFLELLAKEQQKDNRHATLDAWDRARKLFALRGEYVSRRIGLGRGFKDEQFRFQVLDEGDAKAKDWQDTLHQVLANYRV